MEAPDYMSDDYEVYCEDESEILTMEEMRMINTKVPTRFLASTWKKKFCTSTNGYALSNLYRQLKEHLHRPALLVIKDMLGYRFGAFSTDAFHVAKGAYGGGETFVFTFEPEFSAWTWNSLTTFFIVCSQQELCVGLHDGTFAIYLDESLYRGRTQACHTFNNRPLTPTGDFNAASLEVWIFD